LRKRKRQTFGAQLQRDSIALENAARARDAVERNAIAVDRAARRRPGRGTGTSPDDLWQPPARAEVKKVEDPRAGKVFCNACKAPVRHVEVGGKWTVRNQDDDMPHALSCPGDDDERE
jgi:hypothetical protein